MSSLPVIAIVGRPNVGKSSLFNAICKKRVSIVADFSGVTRDLIIEEASFFEKKFLLIDSGGIKEKGIDYSEEIHNQVDKAVELADVLILMVDGKVGPTLTDHAIANWLIKCKKKVILAVNKVDDIQNKSAIDAALCLGISSIFPTSCIQSHGIEDLVEEAMKDFPASQEEEKAPLLSAAIIGRPNVGKSTLMNYLLQEERSIVGEVAGTTRDAITKQIHFSLFDCMLTDTAGIRRKKKEISVIEKFASMRTVDAIEKANVCLFLFDAKQGLTVEDRKIVSSIEKEGKGIIFLCNKWDLISDVRMEHYLKELYAKYPYIKNYPFLFISAKTGRNVEKIEKTIQQVYQELGRKITTSDLNNAITKAMTKYHPPMIMGKRLRIYYSVQIRSYPPTFTLFCNIPGLMTKTYLRYLSHELRKAFGFSGAPLVLSLKGKKR